MRQQVSDPIFTTPRIIETAMVQMSTTDRRRIAHWCVLAAFIAARCFSAVWNIVHDCDEVYNYWEPLHRLVYGYGKQPWEYSPRFALRSYLYIVLHWTIAMPLSMILGNASHKVAVFYSIRFVFASISGFLESRLHRVVTRYLPDIYWTFFVVLLFNCGLTMASTTFLPNTFAMYCLLASTTAVLNLDTAGLIWWSVVGVLVGWSVSGIAFIPYALYVLAQPRLWRSFLTLLGAFVAVGVPFALCDFYFYGRLTLSLMNFIQYNVIGGGQSALYGVESFTFYLRNGFLNFNILLLFSFCLPPVVALVQLRLSRASTKKDEHSKDADDITSGNLSQLLLVCTPVYVWFTAISMLPHKEERFLYVVYPQICLSGALCLVLFTRQLSKWRMPDWMSMVMKSGCLLLYACLSLMRIGAMWINFGSTMQIYDHLPKIAASEKVFVCSGDEWHRFPSSFFLPSPAYRLGFVKQRFSGLLPGDFSEKEFGTREDESWFNLQNLPAAESFVDITSCSFVFDLETEEGEESLRATYDQDRRMFFIPFLNRSQNLYGKYVLYETLAAT